MPQTSFARCDFGIPLIPWGTNMVFAGNSHFNCFCKKFINFLHSGFVKDQFPRGAIQHFSAIRLIELPIVTTFWNARIPTISSFYQSSILYFFGIIQYIFQGVFTSLNFTWHCTNVCITVANGLEVGNPTKEWSRFSILRDPVDNPFIRWNLN